METPPPAAGYSRGIDGSNLDADEACRAGRDGIDGVSAASGKAVVNRGAKNTRSVVGIDGHPRGKIVR